MEMERALAPHEPWISLVEILAGSFIVIAHSVFHIVPNEVPILFALFWISTRLRTGRWYAAQFRRPGSSWVKTFLIAGAAAAVLQLGSELAVQPLAHLIWPQPEQASSLLQAHKGDWFRVGQSLAIIWTFAAFGEETGYRGYLLERAADLGNRSKLANLTAMLYVAVLFGFGHFYKGAPGILDSTYSGLVLGGVYLLTGRNLWAPILAHGLTDTFAVIALFLGWAG